MKAKSTIAGLLILNLAVFAQDGGSAVSPCPVVPFSLSSARNCYRPLLLFAPSIRDPKFVHQIEELRSHASEIKERDIIIVPIISRETARTQLPADLLGATLSHAEAGSVRSSVGVGSDSFRVILVGKDGGQKLSRKAPVSFEELSRLVDSMPMRRQEIKQRAPHAP